jgi:hypothetical protein
MKNQKKDSDITKQLCGDIKLEHWSAKYGRTTAKKIDRSMLLEQGLVCQELVKLRTQAKNSPAQMCWIKYDVSYVEKVIQDDFLSRLNFQSWEELEEFLKPVFETWLLGRQNG